MFKKKTIKITTGKLEDLLAMLKGMDEDTADMDCDPCYCDCKEECEGEEGWVETNEEDWGTETPTDTAVRNLQLAFSDMNGCIDDADENIADIDENIADINDALEIHEANTDYLYEVIEKLSVRLDKTHMFLAALSRETKERFERNEVVIQDLHEAVQTTLDMLAEETLEDTDAEDEDYRELRKAVTKFPLHPEGYRSPRVPKTKAQYQQREKMCPKYRTYKAHPIDLEDVLGVARDLRLNHPPNMHGMRPMDYERDVLFGDREEWDDYAEYNNQCEEDNYTDD